MIIVEKRLKELFDTLPPIVDEDEDFKPLFDFGSEIDLNDFLKDERNKDTRYPIIWLETPLQKTGDKRLTMDLKLVLANQNQYKNESNLSRLENNFNNFLNPLYKNVIKALDQSGFTRIIDRDKIERTDYFKHTQSTDIWDAIKFECKLEMTDCKLKTIYYE